MRDLTVFVEAVVSAAGEAKKAAMVDLIMASHGKKTTKKLAETKVNMMSYSKIDQYACNYLLAGEGLRVE